MNDAKAAPITALIATMDATYMPQRVVIPKPLKVLTEAEDGPNIVDVVNAAAGFFDRAGVLGLDARAAGALGLPTGPIDEDHPVGSDEDPHPAAVALREAEWNVASGIRGWTIIHHPDRPSVNLCLVDSLEVRDVNDHPMIGRSYLDMVSAWDLWHRTTGSAWVAKSGNAGTAVLRDVITDEVDRINREKVKVKNPAKKRYPRWHLPIEDGMPTEATEYAYKSGDPFKGKAAPKGCRFYIGWDASRAYLSGARIAALAPNALRNTGKTPYSKDLAGLWLVELSAWDARKLRLPAPFGYTPDNTTPRWVTGPTLALLDELTARGEYTGYEVWDSWTCGNAFEIALPWAQRLQDAAASELIVPEPGHLDKEAVRTGIQYGYKRAWGGLRSRKSRVYRPDWADAILAQFRCNLWRYMYKVGKTMDKWPVEVNTDCIVYPHVTDDVETEAGSISWTNDKGNLDGIKWDGGTPGNPGTGKLGWFKVTSVNPIPGRVRKSAKEAGE